MTSTSILLEVQGLVVERAGVRVLDVPSFRVLAGERVALMGPNGAGKSTLLLSMLGLVEREAGRLLHRGVEVRSARDAVALRRRLAMVLQDPLLFDATVYDNVAAGLRLRGLGEEQTRRKAREALERFRVGHVEGRAARKLSSGEARRVSLARALAVEPEVVLLDEPFANLDLPTRQAVIDDLDRTVRETGMAAILVTHDPAEALRLADRIAVMEAGGVVQSGAAAEVLRRPVSELVATCVGVRRSADGEDVGPRAWAVAALPS